MRKLTLIRLLLAVLVVPATTEAQRTEPVVELSQIGGARISAAYDLIAAPPYAYALEREQLVVLDVRDPRAVREVAHLEFSGPRLWGVIYGSRLYLGGFGRPLAVVDVSDPLQPRWLGPPPDAPEPIAALLDDDHLLLIESGPSLTLSVYRLDRTVGFPMRVGTLDLESRSGQRFAGMDLDDGRLYVVLEQPRSEGSELAVINLRDPVRPRHERKISLPEVYDYRKVAVRGSLAYATIADADAAFGLATFRLGDTEATMLGSVTDARLWNGGRMIVNGEAIYATFKHAAVLATFDVRDPRTPTLAHLFMGRAGASGMGFSRAGDRLYVSGDAGPGSIFDISEPLAPNFLGSWNYSGGWARTVRLDGNEAVVLSWGLGFLVYDLRDVTSPRLLGSYLSRNGDVDHLDREQNLVLLSGEDLPTEVVDISEPASPVVVARYTVLGPISAGALAFPNAVQALRDGGLMITDVTAPGEPLSYIELERPVSDLELDGSLAVLAHPDGGVTTLDISDAELPAILGAEVVPNDSDIDPEWDISRLALSPNGERAFTLLGEGEEEDGVIVLGVFDLRVPSEVLLLASLRLSFGGYAQDYTILCEGDEVFVGAGSDVIRIDVRDWREPRVVERYRVSVSMEGMAKRDRLLAVAASEDGMQLFELPSRR